jgi:hypothetical protein
MARLEGIGGDQQLFRRTVEAITSEERWKQHHLLADPLAKSQKQ